jgi:hypothetical protein
MYRRLIHHNPSSFTIDVGSSIDMHFTIIEILRAYAENISDNMDAFRDNLYECLKLYQTPDSYSPFERIRDFNTRGYSSFDSPEVRIRTQVLRNFIWVPYKLKFSIQVILVSHNIIRFTVYSTDPNKFDATKWIPASLKG